MHEQCSNVTEVYAPLVEAELAAWKTSKLSRDLLERWPDRMYIYKVTSPRQIQIAPGNITRSWKLGVYQALLGSSCMRPCVQECLEGPSGSSEYHL